MDINEARKKVQITDEERKAVANYLESGHAQMNALISFDIKQYFTLSSRGWLLAGLDNYENKEEVGSEILSQIEELANIYSAMYKNMYDVEGPTKLMRGTSAHEAQKLTAGETYDRILSTTTNETIAKSFGEAHAPAFLRIKVGDDIPFINVTEFMGAENLNRDEEEFILAPFTKIKSATFSSRYNGYTYYDVSLEKTQMRPFEEGEKENFANTIKSEFLHILELGKTLKKLEDEYERLLRNISTTQDREDRIYMSQRRSEIVEQISEVNPKIKEFTSIMKEYIQGRCVEKEKEYLQAYEICRAEDLRIMQEERKAAEEQRRKSGIIDFANRVKKFNQDSQKTPEILNKQYQELLNEESTYANFAQRLGIPYDSYLDKKIIQQNLAQVTNNVIEMGRRILTIKIDKESTMPEVEDALTMIIDYNTSLTNSYRMGVGLSDIVSEYGKENLKTTKKATDERAQQILKNVKLRLLERKKQEIEGRKISLIGRLRGLDKLKTIELEGIKMEMQILKSTPIQTKTSYSIKDTLSDVRAFSMRELSNQMTEDMQFFENTVKEFFGVDEAAIEELARRKLNAHPMVIAPKRRWEWTSEKIKKAISRNEGLQVELSKSQYYAHKDNKGIKQYDGYSARDRFLAVLKNIVTETALPDVPNNEDRSKTIPEIDANPYVK